MNEMTTVQQNVLSDLDTLDRIIRFAELMASGRCTVPKEYHDNAGDCLALSLQAQAWGMNPFTVAQKAYVIKGKIGYEAQLINAVITRHAPITGRPRFTYSDGWEKILGKFKTVQGQNGPYNVPNWNPEDERGLWCEVSATITGEEEPRALRLMLVQAQPRQSTQWATDPKQQLAYNVMKKWARLHCPDIIMGIFTPEEIVAREQPEKDVTPLKAALGKHGESLAARPATDPPPAGAATGAPDGEKPASTESTPENTTQNTQKEDKAQQQTDRIRQKLREQKQVPIAEPTEQDRQTLQMAIDSMASCDTMSSNWKSAVRTWRG